MEPAFYRGDLLFLTNHQEDPIRVGDIVVFKIEGREIPIVHRALRIHESMQSYYFSIWKLYLHGQRQMKPVISSLFNRLLPACFHILAEIKCSQNGSIRQ